MRVLSEDQWPAGSLGEVIRKRGSTRKFSQDVVTFPQFSTIFDYSTRGVPADFLAVPKDTLLDIFLIINAVEELPAGAFYYSASGRAFKLLKKGGFRPGAGYLCLEQDLAADAAAVVFFMSDLQKVLQRFGNRGYRAVQLEAGIVGGKMYLCSYALGLGATRITFYDDDITEFFSPNSEGLSPIFVVALGVPAKARRLYHVS
jgi:SagB-type dehydrogenase family enzyme